MKVKSESEVTQSCPTLIDLMDCSLPGSSVHGIFQARVLEWDAIAFSACLWQGLINYIIWALLGNIYAIILFGFSFICAKTDLILNYGCDVADVVFKENNKVKELSLLNFKLTMLLLLLLLLSRFSCVRLCETP